MRQESHVHLGNPFHPVEETPGSNQATVVGKMRWGPQGWLWCWEAWEKVNGAKAGPGTPWRWVAGHLPWDPQGQELQLHQEYPREQKCVRVKAACSALQTPEPASLSEYTCPHVHSRAELRQLSGELGIRSGTFPGFVGLFTHPFPCLLDIS